MSPLPVSIIPFQFDIFGGDKVHIHFSTLIVFLLVGLSLQLPTAVSAELGAERALEEITVTARKREESLQDTPISISAFTGASLEARNITKIDKISDFTPNLTFENKATFSGSTSNAVVYIRGVGQNEFMPTIDPGVGIYVDGVFLGRSVGSVLDIIDIERVEVLRGPQGTLFGRNTIGGAISITTARPGEEIAGKLDLKAGTDSLFDVRGTIDVPINDRLFSKFTIASFQQDGYVERTFDGKDLGDNDTIAGRVSLRWLPTDSIEVNFSADYSNDEDNGVPLTLTDLDPFGPPPPFAPSQVAFNNAVASLIAGAAAPPGSPVYCVSPAGASDPLCFNQQWVSNDKNTYNGTGPHFSETEVWSASLTVDWEFDVFTLKSITGFRKINSDFATDNDGSPLQIGHVMDVFEQDQISQEIQVLGTAFDNKLNWIVGFYYFNEDGKNLSAVDFASVALDSGGFFDNTSWAVFAQGTYELTSNLSLTFGLRYTEDEKDYLPDQLIRSIDPFVGAALGAAVGDRVLPFTTTTIKTKEAVPMVNLSYYWLPDLMTYFTYSEGFKSGGFTQRIFPPEPSVPTFEPEFVTSYEVGLKWTGFDKKVRLNLAGFFADYEDLQLLVSDPSRLGPFSTNAGSGEIVGFEAELTAALPYDWFLNASLGLTDAEYTELAGNVIGLTLDSRYEHISKWNASASIFREFELRNWGYFTPRLDWSMRSRYFTNDTNINTPQFGLQERALNLINISGRWENRQRNFSVSLGVDNLTGEEYRQHGDFQNGFGWVVQTFDRGRQWYVRAGYEF